MSFHTLFFDLDDTLYPSNNGVWQAILVRIEQYMREQLHIPAAEVPGLRQELFAKYGTTLRGLQILWHVDEHEFVDYVHNVPVNELLSPDPALGEILKCFPQPKYIFTNADRNHAARVLNRLGIADCFDGIIDILDVTPYCKPMAEAFNIALHKAGVDNPSDCIFFDDGLNNLASARALGFYAVRVGSQEPDPACHASIASLRELPGLLTPLLAAN